MDYEKICEELFENLGSRKRNVLERRFGLTTDEPLTLQAIGDEIGITRERVRQIENDAFEWLRESQKAKLEKPFRYFSDYFEDKGGLKEEERLLEDLGREKFKGYVLLFLTLGENFYKFKETDDFYSFWTVQPDYFKQAKEVVDSIIREFEKTKIPLEIEEIGKKAACDLSAPVIVSYVEISKFVFKSPLGLYGLSQWPEINPRGLKDKAYLVLKTKKAPLHFTEIAELIGKLPSVSKKVLPESVHNELIRNDRFVLIGRGIYALTEWGYEPGTVKEIIVNVLEKSKKSLSKKEILKKVLEQRQVKENTILLNLQNEKLFEKDDKGRYSIKRR